MCDFHSAVADRNGTIYHHWTNSHSGIVAINGLALNTPVRQKTWELEWKWRPGASLPDFDNLCRGAADAPEAVRKAALEHYDKLRRYLDGDTSEELAAYFSGEIYFDVQLARVAGKPIKIEGDGSRLDLNGNQLTTLDGVTLPANLESLYLNGNQLTTLDGVTLPANLRWLYLNGNAVPASSLRSTTSKA